MIRYLHFAAHLTQANIMDGFFEGWPQPPSRETHLKLLKNSDYVVLAMDDTNDTMIGFITAITDGVLSAYIPLLEVLPPYRQQGIGRELVSRMLEQLRHLYMIDLMCDPALQTFYGKLEMFPTVGMSKRNFNRPSGE